MEKFSYIFHQKFRLLFEFRRPGIQKRRIELQQRPFGDHKLRLILTDITTNRRLRFD